MSKHLAFTFGAFALSGLLILSSCGSDAPEPVVEEVTIEESGNPEQEQRESSIRKIIYSIPSPVEMASLLMKSGVEFNLDLLNDVENADRYATSKQQAFNLGTYGADLRYTSMYEQDQQSVYYAAVVRKLVKELGVEGAIDEGFYERLQNNAQNRDSLLNIVSNAYTDLNRYLKENDREEISALVIAGGWLEGVYLATQHYTPGNTMLRDRIAEQKYVLNDLLTFMSSYGNQVVLSEVMSDLTELQEEFKNVDIQRGKTETSQDENGTMVIGGSNTINASDEAIAAISAKIVEIRNKAIQ